MKKNLLFVLALLLTNILFAQPFIEIITASAQVAVNTSTGATVAFNVKFYKEIPFAPGISFYAPVGFTISSATVVSEVGTGGGGATYSAGISGLKVVTVSIPRTASLGQTFALRRIDSTFSCLDFRALAPRCLNNA